jgi:hypothetical protein
MRWIEVVTHPLGLVAFALALIFGVIGVKFKARQRPWFLPLSFCLAAITIIAGLYIDYLQIKSKPLSPIQITHQPISSANESESKKIIVNQKTTGPASPAIQGVHGDVNINTKNK